MNRWVERLARLWIFFLIGIPVAFILLFMVTDLKLPNEYRYLDETTILSNGEKVSNLTFKADMADQLHREKFSAYVFNDPSAAGSRLVDFFFRNEYENKIQITDRYYLHENAFVLIPVHNLHLGKPYSEVWSQYGFLSIAFIKAVMEVLGDFSINTYDKINKAAYIVYFLLFALIVLHFFPENGLRIIMLSSLGIMFFANGFESFLYAPGQVPIRHFFDAAVLWLIWMYGRTERLPYLLGAMSLSLLSIWVSKDFGQFVFASFFGTLLFWALIRSVRGYGIKRQIPLVLVVSALFFGLTLLYYPLMPNPGERYFLDGFYAFQTPWYALGVFALVPAGWIFLNIFFTDLYRSRYLLPFLFALFYSGMLLLYFAWSGLPSHLINLMIWLVMPFAMILRYTSAFTYTRLTALLLSVLSGSYLFFLYNFADEWGKFERNFKTHVTYRWDYAGAGGLVSTVDPDVFKLALKDINHFEKGKSVYMISKYETVLTLFSNKQSGLPLFDLRSMLVTTDDFSTVKSMLLRKADTLFVDRDILYDFNAEVSRQSIFEVGSPILVRENLQQRIPKLLLLRELFLQIRDRYKLVKQGDLVNVYQKMSTEE